MGTVALTRASAGEKWGFAWFREYLNQHGIRMLDKIDPESPMGKWNERQIASCESRDEAHTVEPGDRLLKVNGVGENDPQGIQAEMKKNVITCVFYRDEEESQHNADDV